MSELGMTPGEIRAVARSLRARADEIDGLLNSLKGQVDGAPWAGNDRERFVREWDAQHMPGLKSVAQGLRDTAVEADNAATMQERASSI